MPKELLPLVPIVGDKPTVQYVGDEICVKSSTSPVFFVIFPRNYSPSQADVHFISNILAQSGTHIHEALRYLREDPLTEDPDTMVATDPQFTFYSNFEFIVNFWETNLPNARNGVAVSFRNGQPYDSDRIEDPEAWWDDDSGTWIPG
ncbi:MAG: hypothetical protein LBQ20_10265 [Rhodanobacter sp.]|jgi:hypothetical protein|nr:hypothetical protein [Rhodanobacter sp.]